VSIRSHVRSSLSAAERLAEIGVKWRMHPNSTFEPGNMRLGLPTNAINGAVAPRRYILSPPGNHH
jgi:hypothetical protein